MEPNMSSNSNKTEHTWTNEEHLHFLKSMEASFVRTMLENNSPILRLDRYLPDSSESTLDLKSQRKKKHGTPGGAVKQGKCIDYALEDICWDDIVGPSRTIMEGRVEKRSTRRFPSNHKHYDPSQDQCFYYLIMWSHRLISELMIKMNDKDERDLPNVAVAPPMAPAN
ncbi:hypothetical protein SADUNF_Sadunf15G0118000 [Salix dunnii]|uniref:Uncharacterized protein n=1 Tax=Salix dunnii TaxID=1413687 RepID=A0A835JJM4_9ROSI|nr:hypothetical protein SADUNF_Sadunf15G0118000 [Salix dunnii]